jgi:hypothetical protein
MKLKKPKKVIAVLWNMKWAPDELKAAKVKAEKWNGGNLSGYVAAAVRNWKPTRKDLE